MPSKTNPKDKKDSKPSTQKADEKVEAVAPIVEATVKEVAKEDVPEVAVNVEKAHVIVPAELSEGMIVAADKHFLNLDILMKAEDAHDETAKDMIEVFLESRDILVKAGYPKADVPTSIYEALRIRLDASDYSDKLVARAKKELVTITAYFNLGLSIRIRDIPFSLFQKVVELAKDKLISKNAIATASKKNPGKPEYVKALQDIVTVAEYNKLSGEINMGLIPASLIEAINSLSDKAKSESAKYLKVLTSKGASLTKSQKAATSVKADDQKAS